MCTSPLNFLYIQQCDSQIRVSKVVFLEAFLLSHTSTSIASNGTLTMNQKFMQERIYKVYNAINRDTNQSNQNVLRSCISKKYVEALHSPK